MAFIANKIQPNGALSLAHKILKMEIVDGKAMAVINSFAKEQALDAENAMPNWQDTYEVPLDRVVDAEKWLVGGNGPFPGGSIVTFSTPIETARKIKLALIKIERDNKEVSGFPYLGKIFDSDSRSLQRITTSTLAAQTALAAKVDYSVEWTCADNSTIVMNAEQMIGTSVALAVYAGLLHEQAKELKAEVMAAESIDDVEAIQWPSTVAA
jgi:hypothetical protein